MSIVDGNWKTFMARATVLSAMLGVVVFGAVKRAVADPGGPTSPQLTFAGVLRDPSGELPRVARSTTLTFTFTKVGALPCAVTVPDVQIAVGGAFTAPMSIASCPNYFDGSNVTYTVAEGTTILTPDGGVAVTPVPYARFADQAGVNNDCPAGYQRATDASFTGDMRLCQRKRTDGVVYDEVVRVGTGASAFWIDRYEASVWYLPDGSTRGYGTDHDDYSDDSDFPDNGQWTTRPHFAISRAGVSPSRFLTWFQAAEACAASGKRLPSGEEWIRAARGTPDPSTLEFGDGREGRCLTNVATGARVTGGRGRALGIVGCESAWGAQDMIGNVSEWSSEWYVGVGRTSFDVSPGMINGAETTGGMPAWSLTDRTRAGWPTEGGMFHDDRLYNISSAGNPGDGSFRFGAPSGAVRGGSYGEGVSSGIFTLNLNPMPTFTNPSVGFRCVVPR